jgi:uncharacterized protein YxeA
MKKKISIIIGIVLLVVLISGFIYYKLNYIDTKTEYYHLISVVPSEEDLINGKDIKVKFEKTYSYQNDKNAIKGESAHHQQKVSFGLKKRVSIFNKMKKDKDMNLLDDKIYLDIINDIFNEHCILIRFTHRAGYDISDLIKYINKGHTDINSIQSFCNSNKISCAIYNIY